MRTLLSELGYLPVSAMIHLPKAQEVGSEDSSLMAAEDSERWRDYFGRTFDQLM